MRVEGRWLSRTNLASRCGLRTKGLTCARFASMLLLTYQLQRHRSRRISGCGKLGNDLAVAGNQYTEARNRAGADTELMLNPPMLITVMRRHPLALILWIGVLAFMTYLFVDAIKTNSIGYATVRIGFVYGILMIFWLGTILRWVLKYCQERRLWEMDMSPEAENPT